MLELVKTLERRLSNAHEAGFTDLTKWAKEDVLRWLFAPSIGGLTIYELACEDVGIDVAEALIHVPAIYEMLWQYLKEHYSPEKRG